MTNHDRHVSKTDNVGRSDTPVVPFSFENYFSDFYFFYREANVAYGTGRNVANKPDFDLKLRQVIEETETNLFLSSASL